MPDLLHGHGAAPFLERYLTSQVVASESPSASGLPSGGGQQQKRAFALRASRLGCQEARAVKTATSPKASSGPSKEVRSVASSASMDSK